MKEGAALLAVLLVAGLAASARAQPREANDVVGTDYGRSRVQPQLTLAAERVVDGVTVAVDVVNQTGVLPYLDAHEPLSGSDVSVFLARGARGAPDPRGLLPQRETYEGPLTVRIHRPGRVRVVDFDGPTSPTSSPRRTIFSRRLPLELEPGDSVVIEPVEGWLEQRVRFEVPTPGVDASWTNTALFAGIGFALFFGLLSLALAIRDPAAAAAK